MKISVGFNSKNLQFQKSLNLTQKVHVFSISKPKYRWLTFKSL